jgi:hypothetical protein
MSLKPRYWWQKWCSSSNSTSLSSSISRCQTLQTLHHFRHQYRGVSLFKLYITFVINIEVSGSSNSTSLSSSISRCQAHQTLHHFRHQYRGVRLFKHYITFVINIEVSGSSNSTSPTLRYWWRKWCKVWWAWHLDIDDESDVMFEEPDTSILMTKVM